jgi:hypothetical protein
VSEPTSDVDEQLAQIRAALEPEYGEEFDFYAEAVTGRCIRCGRLIEPDEPELELELELGF